MRAQLKVVSTVLLKLKVVNLKLTMKFVKVSAERDPEQIDNDSVNRCLKPTGFFAKKDAAEKHLHEGWS